MEQRHLFPLVAIKVSAQTPTKRHAQQSPDPQRKINVLPEVNPCDERVGIMCEILKARRFAPRSPSPVFPIQ